MQGPTYTTWEGKYREGFLPEFDQWLPDFVIDAYKQEEGELSASPQTWSEIDYSGTHTELVTNILAAKKILDKHTTNAAVKTIKNGGTVVNDFNIAEMFAGDAPISRNLSKYSELAANLRLSAYDITQPNINQEPGLPIIETYAMDIYSEDIPNSQLNMIIDQNGLYTITFGAVLSHAQVQERYRIVLQKYFDALTDRNGTLILNSPIKNERTENFLQAVRNFFTRERAARDTLNNLAENGDNFNPLLQDLPDIFKILRQNKELINRCELITSAELTKLLDDIGFQIITTQEGLYYGANILIKAKAKQKKL